MKVKNIKLEYNVLNYDWNKKEVVNYNALSCLNLEEIRKQIKKGNITDYESLKYYLDKEFWYYFKSRTEFEILVSDLHGKEWEKIDIYRQINMNLDLVVNYVIKEMKIEF